MLLVVDLGNTHTTFGLFDGERLQARRTVKSDLDAFESLLESWPGVAVDGAALASVVPSLTETTRRMLDSSAFLMSHAPTRVVEREIPLDVQAQGAGADRLMNALAAHRFFGDALVLDLGTATTFERVLDGVFLGGLILPGWGCFNEALTERTAQLPAVPLPEEGEEAPEVLGQNTSDAIRSGLYYGYRDMLEGLIKRFKTPATTVVATGGLGGRIASLVDRIEPDLTLHGLRFFWESDNG